MKEDLKITHPNKVYWPKDGYKKIDLINYYKSVSKYILPYLKNRPMSLNRYPEGIYGEHFYQKNMVNYPTWIKTFKVKHGEDSTNYLVCEDEKSLLYMVNLGCIELNPWSSTIDKLENPDFMIIDLDPLNVKFEEVKKVALETKKILDLAKLKSFCKTSGLTGIHILVPMGAKYSYKTVKNFAKIIAVLLHESFPFLTSLERRPQNRKNKIYIDYLQNNKGQTIASAYSVRPVDGAPVSTPLNWDELKRKFKPSDFNIENTANRLELYGDILNGLLDTESDIVSALEHIKKNKNIKD